MKFDKLTEIISESIHDRNLFKAIILAGSPYAGKSYVADEISKNVHSVRKVNFDKFYEKHGDIKKSKINTINQASLYINSMLPLIIDTTSERPNRLFLRLAALTELGYDLGLCVVYTDWQNIEHRHGTRQRKVGLEFVKKVYDTVYSQEYMNSIKRFFKTNNIFNVMNNGVKSEMDTAINRITKFYNSPVENPTGKEILHNLHRKKGHYISDSGKFNPQEINNITSLWFN